PTSTSSSTTETPSGRTPSWWSPSESGRHDARGRRDGARLVRPPAQRSTTGMTPHRRSIEVGVGFTFLVLSRGVYGTKGQASVHWIGRHARMEQAGRWTSWR